MIEFPNKKYKIIYADPPWQYSKYSNTTKETSDEIRVTPYDAMTLNDIQNLPIQNISETDSILLLWVTLPCLDMGLKVIESWGFTYKTTAFTWIKKNKKGIGWFMGFGHYTRSNAELCLLATRGKILPVLKNNMSQLVITPITKHSKKPNLVRDKIVNLFGDLPRIELFARSRIHGWDVWGNDEKLESTTPLEAFL